MGFIVNDGRSIRTFNTVDEKMGAGGRGAY